MSAAGLLRSGEAVAMRPVPRWRLPPERWAALAAALVADPLELLALWADAAEVHALFLEDGVRPLLGSVAVGDGSAGVAALSTARPAAAAMERAVTELWGHALSGGVAPEAWLDHGAWTLRRPMAAAPLPAVGGAEPPALLPPEGAGEHAIGLGPAGGPADPAHLRVTVGAGRVVRLEPRGGYGHRGVSARLRGGTPEAAAALVSHLDAEGSVAHALAFCRAVEAALAAPPPPRAVALRRVLGELERAAVHLLVLGRVAALAGPPAAASLWPPLRERLLRGGAAAFGHRLLMGTLLPGGLAADLRPEGASALANACAAVLAAVPGLLAGFDAPGGLAHRLNGLGRTRPEWVAELAVGGVAGRAAGRGFDARLPDPDTGEAAPGGGAALLRAGDATARLRLRLVELAGSLGVVARTLASLPEGPVRAPLPPGGGEGLGWSEGAHGDHWCWVRLEGGVVLDAFPADPAWRCWPLAARAAVGAEPGELPLLLASLAPGVDGMDL